MKLRALLCAVWCCVGISSGILSGQELPEPVPADQITSAAITECPRELAFVSGGVYYYYCVECVPGDCDNGPPSTKIMGFDSEVPLGCAPGNPCDCNADAEPVVVIGRSKIQGAVPMTPGLGESVQLNDKAQLFKTEWQQATHDVVWAESSDGGTKPFQCFTVRTRNQAGEIVFHRDLALELALPGGSAPAAQPALALWHDNVVELRSRTFDIVPIASPTGQTRRQNGD